MPALRLAPHARLRRDRRGEAMLLWPERGMWLNASAARVIELLDGSRDVHGIVSALAAEAPAEVAEASLDLLDVEVRRLLEALAARALLEEVA